MRTFGHDDLTDISANTLHVGHILALTKQSLPDEQYPVVAIDQVEQDEQGITIHYDLPLGTVFERSIHALIQIERIDWTSGVPSIQVSKRLTAGERVWILPDGWERLFAPRTLFVMGQSQLEESQKQALEREAHTSFATLIFLTLPKGYGKLKREVQSRVAEGSQAYLFVDWFGLHEQAVTVDEQQFASWFPGLPLEAFKANRAIHFPGACVNVALFSAEGSV